MRIRTLIYSLVLALLFPVTFLAVSCSEEDCCVPGPNQELIDSWLFTEYGYSPGSGYIVEEVPANPPMILTLNEDGTCSSNVEDLENYHYYLVLDDPHSGRDILAFYTNEPIEEDQDISQLSHSYSIELTEGLLKLYFRYCIEGCHLGFERLDQN